MKTIAIHKLKYFFLICFLSGFVNGIYAEEIEAIDINRKKEINHSFTVNNNSQLNVDNRYGEITVTHWKKNEVSVRVVIESKSRNESRAQAALERVKIDIKESGNTISASTSITSQNGNNNDRLTINYYIQAPADLPLKLEQKYGNINLPNQNDGVTHLIVGYGNIRAGNFSRKLHIEGKYSNIKLENVQNLSMDIKYCGDVTIKNGEDIAVDCGYSNLNLGNIRELKMDKKYGNLKAKEIQVLKVEAKYSDLTVEKLSTELMCELSYTTLTIKEIAPTFNAIRASARYGNLNLGISEKANFYIEANNMRYGSFKMNGFNTPQMNVVAPNYYNYTVNNGGNAKITFNGNNYSNITIKKL